MISETQYEVSQLAHFEAHDGSIRHGRLVEIIQTVDQTQQRHQVQVNLAQQLLLLLRRQGERLSLELGKSRQGHVCVVAVGMLEHDGHIANLALSLAERVREPIAGRGSCFLDVGHGDDSVGSALMSNAVNREVTMTTNSSR